MHFDSSPAVRSSDAVEAQAMRTPWISRDSLDDTVSWWADQLQMARALLAGPVANNDPRMVAWKVWRGTEEYANAERWLLRQPPNIEGELWAAFIAGWDAAGVAASEVAPAIVPER